MQKQIKAELVLASLNSLTNDILYTFKLTMPRIILAEANTHTIASKNTSSSRAIPTKKLLSSIIQNPFIPISIGQYQSGMQAGSEITGWRRKTLEKIWSVSRYAMVGAAFAAWRLGAPKQFSNRLIEPWMWTEQIWTTTDPENEIALRYHPDAEPHYQELARQKAQIVKHVKEIFAYPGGPEKCMVLSDMKGYYANKCQILNLGEWHMPFTKKEDYTLAYNTLSKNSSREFKIDQDYFSFLHKGKTYEFPNPQEHDFWQSVLKYVSCARCAWVSYEMPGEEKMNNIIAALITYHKLVVSEPKHLSPTQHVATPLPTSVRVGNLVGWLQHRKEIQGESGGDKVVVSVTPDMAKQLLSHPTEPLKITINEQPNV